LRARRYRKCAGNRWKTAHWNYDFHVFSVDLCVRVLLCFATGSSNSHWNRCVKYDFTLHCCCSLMVFCNLWSTPRIGMAASKPVARKQLRTVADLRTVAGTCERWRKQKQRRANTSTQNENPSLRIRENMPNAFCFNLRCLPPRNPGSLTLVRHAYQKYADRN
jgi:hypothetical protein